MIYKHDIYKLSIEGSRGAFYKDKKLRFLGDAYIAMKYFVEACKDADVTKKFKTQIATREECRQNINLKNEVKNGTTN